MESREVDPRARHEGGEPGEEIEGLGNWPMIREALQEMKLAHLI